MKYHDLFVIFEKSCKILNCRLLQIIRVNWFILSHAESNDMIMSDFHSSPIPLFNFRIALKPV